MLTESKQKGRETYLAGANFIKGHESKGLGEHARRKIDLGHSERNKHAGEQELRKECHRFDPKPSRGRSCRGEVQLDVVRTEVVPMINAGDVMEVGV